MANIQKLLDKPNPDYDPNSPASKKRRATFQENPVADIRKYLKARKANRSSPRK